MKTTNDPRRDRHRDAALGEAGDRLQSIFSILSCCFSSLQDTERLAPAYSTHGSQITADTHSKTRSVR